MINEPSVLNSSGYLLFSVTLYSKHPADSSWNIFQGDKLHSHSVCLFSSLPFEFLNHWKCLLLVFKRGTGPVGAFHTSDIPEFYGLSASPDFIGTDALGTFSNLSYHRCSLTYFGCCYYSLAVNFANTGNPTLPRNPMSLLSNVDWKPWDSSAQHPLLTFLDPAPNVSITSDTYRADAMNVLNNITLGLALTRAS